MNSSAPIPTLTRENRKAARQDKTRTLAKMTQKLSGFRHDRHRRNVSACPQSIAGACVAARFEAGGAGRGFLHCWPNSSSNSFLTCATTHTHSSTSSESPALLDDAILFVLLRSAAAPRSFRRSHALTSSTLAVEVTTAAGSANRLPTLSSPGSSCAAPGDAPPPSPPGSPLLRGLL